MTTCGFWGSRPKQEGLTKMQWRLCFKYLNALRGRLPRSMAELDEELAEYINHLYQEGDAVTLAGWTLSGLKRFYPRCKPHLLTSQLFLRNWQRVHLPQRTSPMTWLGAKAMAGAAYKVGRPDLALSIFLGFAFFLANYGAAFVNDSAPSHLPGRRYHCHCHH